MYFRFKKSLRHRVHYKFKISFGFLQQNLIVCCNVLLLRVSIFIFYAQNLCATRQDSLHVKSYIRTFYSSCACILYVYQFLLRIFFMFASILLAHRFYVCINSCCAKILYVYQFLLRIDSMCATILVAHRFYVFLNSCCADSTYVCINSCCA